jgi:hypothetical protein
MKTKPALRSRSWAHGRDRHGRRLNGTRCYGAIRDKRAGLAAMSLFPKMWDQEDPSVTYTMTQSAPLMVPGNPNNSFRLVVA